MTRSIKALVVALVAVAALGGAVGAGAAPAQEYVPFVTDFPQSSGTAEFVPFVTDFGIAPRGQGEPVVIGPPRPAPPVVASPSHRWGDLAVGWAVGFGFALVLGGAVLGVRRRLTAAAH